MSQPETQVIIRKPKQNELGKLFFAIIKTLPTTIDYKLARYLITSQSHECFVVIVEGNITGFCFFGLSGEEKTLWYDFLGTDPEFRSKGHGRLLIHHLEEYAIENGYDKVGIIIHLFNASHAGAENFFNRESYHKEAIKDNTQSFFYIKNLENVSNTIKEKSQPRSIISKTLYLVILSFQIIALIAKK
ncbi:MAG: GNAT family N-acetyltransferase [Pseudomonadota bacterium]